MSEKRKTAIGVAIKEVKDRIIELNKADAAFCEDRWGHDPLKKIIGREGSNECHARRRELEDHLKRLIELRDTTEKEGLIDARKSWAEASKDSDRFSMPMTDEDWYNETFEQ